MPLSHIDEINPCDYRTPYILVEGIVTGLSLCPWNRVAAHYEGNILVVEVERSVQVLSNRGTFTLQEHLGYV